MSPTAKAFTQLHVSIILAGFTGILGKLITMSEGMLVWYRMALTFVIFALFLLCTRQWEKVAWRDVLKIGFTGVLICLHWLFFYGSIKLSNVSIGVVCFSLVGFFTALLEPVFMRTRFSPRELAYSVLTVLGVMLIFSFDVRYRLGIIIGVIAAVLSALYTISIRKLCSSYSPSTTLLYQMGGGVAFLTLLLPFYLNYFDISYIIPTWQDFSMLLILAVFCTIGMTFLLIQSLQVISAFTVNLSYNLEPVYSIAIAIAFLGEAHQLNFSFYAGLSCIILSVILQSLWVLHQKKVPAPV